MINDKQRIIDFLRNTSISDEDIIKFNKFLQKFEIYNEDSAQIGRKQGRYEAFNEAENITYDFIQSIYSDAKELDNKDPYISKIIETILRSAEINLKSKFKYMKYGRQPSDIIVTKLPEIRDEEWPKKILIRIAVNDDELTKLVHTEGLNDGISGRFEFIGILDSLKQQELEKIKLIVAEDVDKDGYE